MSNEELIRAARQGDDEAFYSLMVHHREQLYRIAFSYLKNEADALEAIQEVTFRAYVQLGKLKEPSYFSSWLIRILLNYCADEIKKLARRKEEHQHPRESPVESQEHALLERMQLEFAVDQLDPHYQTVIQLKYYHDLTITEIAKTLQKPEGTIKTWLHKALSGLRLHMKKGGELDG
ncbi:MAG: sigma-70 family RNA polymerase sigma factor [Candidatus Cohnella colombiensis]|uniref:Sigma-70 family RNA polymerase sigma factor n=1 Tax=Candidatus Cohnella colombiensis TaxID=3121368 RepID=A0AA95JAK5_9BACL|nr:MAG: sigma-70 family RNA polymerase sigma factor [Cohnella sp.]